MNLHSYSISIENIQEGMLEKHEFLNWLLDVFGEKCRSPDEGALKLILPVVMQVQKYNDRHM